VAASVALLMAFSKLELNAAATKVVRKLSPAAFGVYLIHCHPLIFAKLTGQFAFLLGFPALQMTGMLLGAGMAIYVPCLLADLLRLFLFRKLGFRKLMDRLDARMAGFLQEPVK